MKDQEIKQLLINLDNGSLEGRVKRFKDLKSASYRDLPDLIWDYLTLLNELYIQQHDIAVVLICASVIEMVLSDQVMKRLSLTINETERFSLENLETLSFRTAIIDQTEREKITEIRKLRNYLIHGNSGKIEKIATKKYQEWGLDIPGLGSTLFFSLHGGLDENAKEFITFTGSLLVKFYGTQG